MQQHSRIEHVLTLYLHQVVEDSEAIGVLALLHLHERAQLSRGEGDVSFSHDNLQLLAANLVWRRPVGIVFLQDLRGQHT